jgi:acyl-CoA synthetase (AMP-forming)/AMP-acid ligase II
MNLYKQFINICEQYPHHVAITDNSISLTYEELKNRVHEKMASITSPSKTCGIIYLPKSIDTVAWQLAMNAKDIAFLTLEHEDTGRLKAAIEKCRPSFIVYQDKVSMMKNPQTYDCAYIVFSSGSTGEPKKIMLNDEAVVEVVLAQAKITQMNTSQVFLWLLNPAFDASLSDIYMTLLSGGHLVVTTHKPSDIKIIAGLIDKYNVTHTDIPPVVFKVWLRFLESHQLNSLQHIVFGGEKANEKMCQALLQYFNLYNAYGPTETTICSSLKHVNHNWVPEDIGLPLPGVEYKIVDGELHIGGHCAVGYDNENLDKKFYTTDKKWFMSGDLVEFKNDTYHYVGRKDRQFKHNGQLICPEEIEAAAIKCGADVARVEYHHKITLRFSGHLNKEQMTQYLPVWMIPHHFEEVELKLNNNWKVIG